VDAGIVLEGLGRKCISEPYVTTVVFAGGLIERLGSPTQKNSLLPAVAAGSMRISVASGPPPFHGPKGCVAGLEAGRWRVTGNLLAHDGPSCESFLVLAQLQTEPTGTEGLFLLRRGAPGLTEEAFPTLDGRPACVLRMEGVPVEDWVGQKAIDADAVAREMNRAVAASCAEAVGSIQCLLDTTVAYARTRAQFGRVIAENQVVKHRLVDMQMHCEEARAITLRALLLCENDPGGLAASGARLKVARCGAAVGELAIQLHGAMGMTEELEVGQHVKRLLAFDMRLGTHRHHLRRRMAAAKAAT
jgi:hypothetical protein